MASLISRLTDLITAIGADVKALQNRITDQYNASTTNQTVAGNSENYLAGSNIAIPTGKVKVGTMYRCKFNAVKTGAGTAAPVITVKVGTGAASTDTNRATLTFAAQTGVIDEGEFELEFAFRTAGATATIQATGSLLHRLVTTGFNITGIWTQVLNLGGSFDVTGANLKIGVAVNPGASASWTVSLVEAELINLTP